MAKISREELIDAASQFVEAMREDFDRSFELVDFRSYVRVYRGWRDADWHDMEGEAALIQYFNGHYDLERQPIGAAPTTYDRSRRQHPHLEHQGKCFERNGFGLRRRHDHRNLIPTAPSTR